MGRKALICLLVLLFAGCGFFTRRAGLKNCEYSLQSVTITEATLTDMTLDVGILTKNTNDTEVAVDKMDYEFFINGKKAFQGAMGQGVTINPGGSETIRSEIKLDYVELGSAIAQSVKDEQANYDIRGTVYLKSSLGTFPFAFFVSK